MTDALLQTAREIVAKHPPTYYYTDVLQRGWRRTVLSGRFDHRAELRATLAALRHSSAREKALREALLIIFTEWEAYVLPDSDGFPDDPCAVINDAWKNGFYEKARAALAGGEGE